jgi:hypothetical protein
MTTATPPSSAALPSQLKVKLWKRIDRKLRAGDVLITNEQFFKAMVRDFRRIVGVAPDRRIKMQLLEMIVHVNERHPETYLSAGIRNAVNSFFKSTADDDDWAREMIVRMVKEGRTAMWLEGMGIDIDARALTGAVEQAIIRVAEGKKLRPPARPARQERRRRSRRGVAMVGVNTSQVDEPADEPAEVSVYGAPPTDEEEKQRSEEERQRTEEFTDEEIRRAPRNLDAYLDQKLLSEEEVQDLKKLYGIDKRLADGEIDDAEAERLRGELSDAVRRKLQERLREAVDHSVHYLAVHEALKRLPAGRDDALRFLVRFKKQVFSGDEEIELSAVTKTLEEDPDLLEAVGTLMERKDHEMRMMAANMPPYRHVYRPDQELAKPSIREDFVDGMRELSREDLSERLNSEDGDLRVRTAADIKCMVALLTTLQKTTTPFHREVRRLRIVLRLRKLFDGAIDKKDGRNRVQQFMRRRLHNLYPDLSRDERAEIEKASQTICEGRGDDEEKEDKSKRVYRV